MPSHRRLPHLGSKVAFPLGPVLREIAGHNIGGAAIGRLAYGEYIYAADDADFEPQEWMQVVSPSTRLRLAERADAASAGPVRWGAGARGGAGRHAHHPQKGRSSPPRSSRWVLRKEAGMHAPGEKLLGPSISVSSLTSSPS